MCIRDRVIGAEDKFRDAGLARGRAFDPHRWQEALAAIQFQWIVRRQHRGKDRHKHKEEDDDSAGYGRFIVQKPRPGVTPKRAGRSRQGIGDIRRCLLYTSRCV